MHETAEHRFAQLLLARFLLLNLLNEEADGLSPPLSMAYRRRLWVLLQVQPTVVFGKDFHHDVFTELSQLLRETATPDLKSRIRSMYQQLSCLLDSVRNPATNGKEVPPFFCVVDEAQTAVTLRMGEFMSDDGITPRSLLREIFLSYTTMLSSAQMRLVLSGTGIDVRLFKETLNSPVHKEEMYDIKTDIGAFDDVDAQAKYIMQYVPAKWSQPEWQGFLDRAWMWMRGRCRILPHKILCPIFKALYQIS